MLCCLPWRRQGFRPRVGRWTVQTGLSFWYLWQDLAPLAQVVNLILNVVFGSRDMCLSGSISSVVSIEVDTFLY